MGGKCDALQLETPLTSRHSWSALITMAHSAPACQISTNQALYC